MKSENFTDTSFSMEVVQEAFVLFQIGFAVHWLKEKSKAPVLSGWTKGPRKSWADFYNMRRPGYNLGVRLGEASRIGDSYLAVIDGDVKSKNPKYLKEIEIKLKELFPGIDFKKVPQVKSGRGNGSFHYYVKTKTPLTPRRLAQSSATVKVHMPSVKPSKRDVSKLGIPETNKGFRLRPAWELSLMGEGQQVVLPPSIHPDSNKPYTWGFRIRSMNDIPLLSVKNLPTPEVKKVTPSVELDFKPIEIDLKKRKVSTDIIELIEDGKNCEDRSAGLFTAAGALYRLGFSDEEILSVLTDKNNFLGSVAFEHRKTDSRKAAMDWILKYTLPKAKDANDPKRDFEFDYVEAPKLSPEETKIQMEEIERDTPWQSYLERGGKQSGFKIKNTLKNVVLILESVVGKNVFIENEFSGLDIYGLDTPWGGKEGAEIRDKDIVQIKYWIAETFKFEATSDRIIEAVCLIADNNKFHPVRDWLRTLKWDGKERVDTWMKDYLQAKAPEPYLTHVSRKTLCAMIARVMNPGTKFDQVLILEGKQGIGKSTAVRKLASDEWFTDAHLNIADKDAILYMKSAWIIELGELSSFNKTEINQLKEFISRSSDRIRVPYGRRMENFPRQCIFIGTTNNDEFLKDETGNRRFWPVEVGDCDFEKLALVREQLFAEAFIMWEFGEPLYLSDKRSQTQAGEVQATKVVHDALDETFHDFAERNANKPKERQFNLECFQMKDLFQEDGPFFNLKMNMPEQKRVAILLKKMGYKKTTIRTKKGKFEKRWKRG